MADAGSTFVYNRMHGGRDRGRGVGRDVEVRVALANAEGERCPYCDRAMSSNASVGDRLFPTRDHLVPHSRGGKLTKENWIICCARCNEHKGNLTLSEWAAQLVSAKDWIRLEGVAGVILDVYEELGEMAGYRIVHGPPERVPEARVYNKLLCRFPACACVATCTYKFGDQSGKPG